MGVTVETFDLSTVIARVKPFLRTAARNKAKMEVLKDYTSWEGIPEAASTISPAWAWFWMN